MKKKHLQNLQFYWKFWLNRRMNDFFDNFKTPYVHAQTLLALLGDYQNPRDWISRQTKSGHLVRLKNGLFVIAKRDYLLPQLANILYGPSYVSLQWALSFYGLIPERAMTVTSVTTRRNKNYQTPLGQFTYHHLNQERYCLSFHLVEDKDPAKKFLIATPEKALVDFVHFYCASKKVDGLLEELISSHRFSPEDLRNLDLKLVANIDSAYHSSSVNALNRALKKL